MCYLFMIFYFFFFKQKTAYEMRISDWSSDVCSSDLAELVAALLHRNEGRRAGLGGLLRQVVELRFCRKVDVQHTTSAPLAFGAGARRARHQFRKAVISLRSEHDVDLGGAAQDFVALGLGDADRSEEHTSELQSLMSISHGLFCLKKKKQ